MYGKGLAAIAALIVCVSSSVVSAATKTVDLDAQPTNGAESKCDLNVLSSFPVTIENVVTNKAVGDAFQFTWASAGPGGFTSAVTSGTTGGVGARWTWSTNQTVVSYTGSSCERDICFLKTAGPDSMSGTCSLGCLDDGVSLTTARGTAGAVNLSWTGGTPNFTVFRSNVASRVTEPVNALTTTNLGQTSDTPPAGGIFFYRVRGSTCNQLKACSSNAQCSPASEGICVSRGPFAVPGRSLSSTDVTVSSASLTSSLITFFSPPKEVFRVTSTAQPGGTIDAVTNHTTQPVTIVTEAYPPGCCPSGTGDHPVRCGEACTDTQNDPNNCGACGNVCGDGTCCTGGECVSLCGEGRIWCDGQCVDPENDSDNCGACGNVCGDGTCCGGGFCGSTCELGRTFCDGMCLDTAADRDNCGGCGIACDDNSVCDDGACVPCAEGTSLCGNQCIALGSDPYNCGQCGNDCNAGCAPGTRGVCSSEQTCSCAPGTPLPRSIPPISSPPVAAFCPTFDDHPAPVVGVCPTAAPSGPIEGEIPLCVIDPATTTVAAGTTSNICHPGGVLFKEIASQVSVCGDGIPGPDGACQGGISNVTTGTFMRLVPDTDTSLGAAYLTPYAVHVTSESGNNNLLDSGGIGGDGLMQPGETVTVLIDVVNAGPSSIQSATATLTSPAVDLTEDGTPNPVGVTILTGTVTYGTIVGTQPTTNCEPVNLHPASSTTAFRFTIPANHPGDTTRPFQLQFTGTVNGAPFTMTMPIAIGIADRCDPAAATRDYDGIEGLMNPLARLVPVGDAIPFPTRALNAGNTAPLKLRQLCGAAELKGADVDPPQIVGLSEATRGPLDVNTLTLNDDLSSNDPFFRWNDSTKRWIFNMRTSQLGTGVFTLTIKVAGRKDYVTGFELR
jgi:hypothetical protein